MFATDRPAWQNPRIITLLVLVFLAGACTGALSMRSGLHQRMHGGELSYEQLKTELKLTPKQAEQIKTILDDFYHYNQDIQAQIEDFRATGKNQIRSILDDGQKKVFDKLSSEVQTR
jgi:Spy/CpxP family protein refolding chaperone